MAVNQRKGLFVEPVPRIVATWLTQSLKDSSLPGRRHCPRMSAVDPVTWREAKGD
jgi:hypothetical protein